MIVKMKKVVLLTLDQFRKETLTQLADLGLLHIKNQNKASMDLALAEEDKRHLEEAITALDSVKVSVTTVMEKSPLFGLDLAKSILHSNEKIKYAKEKISLLENEKSEILPWGEFSLSDWHEIRDMTGARLIKVTRESRKELIEREDLSFILIGSFNRSTFWIPAIILPNRTDFDWSSIPGEFFDPSRDLVQIEQELDKERRVIASAETELKDFNNYKAELNRALEEQNYRVLFESVLSSSHLVEGVAYWEAYLPEEKVPLFKESARLNGWAYFLCDPVEEDNVPTQLKMNSFTSMLAPLFDLLGTFPGYRERDISFPFLVFFLIFVAFLIGDAGYGIIYLLAGLGFWISDLLHKRLISDISKLTISIGIMITIWGALTGTWFGSQLVNLVPSLKDLVIPVFSGENSGTQKLIIFLVLSLGFGQIILAHLWNFFWEIKKGEKVCALSQLGWLSIVTAVGWMVLYLVIDRDKYLISGLVFFLAGIGLIFVLLFGSQRRGVSFMKGVLIGLGGVMQTVLGCISIFSDIVSYIRLFAVGLSGIAIADSFNSLGIGLFNSGFLGILGGGLIILVGNTICLALGMLSMIVHGVRLNLLEFSSHLGQEWGGYLYKPFEKKN